MSYGDHDEPQGAEYEDDIGSPPIPGNIFEAPNMPGPPAQPDEMATIEITTAKKTF